jgi:hypothetical protein
MVIEVGWACLCAVCTHSYTLSWELHEANCCPLFYFRSLWCISDGLYYFRPSWVSSAALLLLLASSKEPKIEGAMFQKASIYVPGWAIFMYACSFNWSSPPCVIELYHVLYRLDINLLQDMYWVLSMHRSFGSWSSTFYPEDYNSQGMNIKLFFLPCAKYIEQLHRFSFPLYVDWQAHLGRVKLLYFKFWNQRTTVGMIDSFFLLLHCWKHKQVLNISMVKPRTFLAWSLEHLVWSKQMKPWLFLRWSFLII